MRAFEAERLRQEAEKLVEEERIRKGTILKLNFLVGDFSSEITEN